MIEISHSDNASLAEFLLESDRVILRLLSQRIDQRRGVSDDDNLRAF